MRARLRVVDQRFEHLLGFDVGLVAERDEAGEPETLAPEQDAKLDTEVAALRDQSDGPVSAAELATNSSAPASETPMQFGPSKRAPAGAHLRHDARLTLAARRRPAPRSRP